MTDPSDSPKPAISARPVDYLANERTFLAWLRTSLGLMAFGFVLEKFSLFLKEITLLLDKEHSGLISTHKPEEYSSFFGEAIIILGMVIAFLSLIQYRKIIQKLDKDCYRPTFFLNTLLTVSVLVIGIFLLLYVYLGRLIS